METQILAQKLADLGPRVQTCIEQGDVVGAFAHLSAFLGDAQANERASVIETLRTEIDQHLQHAQQLRQIRQSPEIDRQQFRSENARLIFAALELLGLVRRLLADPSSQTSLTLRQRLVDTLPTAAKSPDGNSPRQAAEIFVSYTHGDHRLADSLVLSLVQHGFSVWFDHDLFGGDRFAKVIDAQIDGVKAVVALWSNTAIKSQWVAYESARAHKLDKLVPVRHHLLAPEHIPADWPQDTHILKFGDDEGLHRSLLKLGCSKMLHD